MLLFVYTTTTRTGSRHLKMSAWEGMAQAAHNHLRACLHEGGGPQVGKVTWGALPHLQMPHLRDLQGGQMPRSSRGRGGGVGCSWN